MDTEPPTRCPHEPCPKTFTCDGCLDQHLRRAHRVRYADVYGESPAAWLDLCARHATLEPNRLGAVTVAAP